MNKVTKWLQSLTPDDFSKSNTTSSVYYLINGLQIRLADHITYHPKECDVQILLPINKTSMYVVSIKEGLQILGFSSIEELSSFITNYALTNKIKKTSEELRETKSLKPDRNTVKDLIVNGRKRTSPVNWSKLCEYLYIDCPKFKKLPKGFKQVCKELFATKKSYEECLQLITTAVNSQNLSISKMKSYFEPYLNKHLN